MEKKTKNHKNTEVAIKVEGLSKTFKIPHEKETTMKGAAINMFNPDKKGFEIFNALKDISFEVKKGEFLGIIGRNGCGKSTLLKILAGIYVPDKNKGEISINGKLSPFLELGVGFNPELSGRENIYLGGTLLGLTRKQIAEKYDQIVAFSELEEFIDMKLRNYSSGMQVRLAFALSINVEADILLMDEVLAVGDTNFQNKCLAEFNRYKEMGKTVVLVTHDIATVQRYCDRAILIRSGEIIKSGSADEVGNEYMQQNISDEERRIVDEQAKSEESGADKNKSTKKIAEITNVELLGEDYIKKNVFENNKLLRMRVFFKKKDIQSLLNFGVGIFSEEGLPIFGTNTFIDKVDTLEVTDKGSFTISIDHLPLNTGSYQVRVALWGKTEAELYDYSHKAGVFRVFSKEKTDGIVTLNYKWEK